MKIKKAFDICKKSHNIATFKINEEEQWLTNGFAAWPLCGVPDLSEEYICQLYDITDKQSEKIHFQINMNVPKTLNFDDACRYEIPAQPMTVNILIKGKGSLQPLLFERGLVLVEKVYLEPLTDTQEEDISYWIRYIDNENFYVAVKVGLLLCAVIYPTPMTDSDYTAIESIYTAAVETMRDKILSEKTESHNQYD